MFSGLMSRKLSFMQKNDFLVTKRVLVNQRQVLVDQKYILGVGDGGGVYSGKYFPLIVTTEVSDQHLFIIRLEFNTH